MQKSDIKSGKLYSVASGPPRKVTEIKDRMVRYRAGPSHIKQRMPLGRFAREAVADVTIKPALALVK